MLSSQPRLNLSNEKWVTLVETRVKRKSDVETYLLLSFSKIKACLSSNFVCPDQVSLHVLWQEVECPDYIALRENLNMCLSMGCLKQVRKSFGHLREGNGQVSLNPHTQVTDLQRELRFGFHHALSTRFMLANKAFKASLTWNWSTGSEWPYCLTCLLFNECRTTHTKNDVRCIVCAA